MSLSERPDHRDLLLDVSRLVWRVWRGGLPTGIDRVCLAYLRHYRHRAFAVVQRKSLRRILSARQSDRLFDILLASDAKVRTKLVKSALTSFPVAGSAPPRRGMVYVNVGHTGLDEPSLPKWIDRHDLRAVFMVHDLIPITHPQFCRPGEAEKHRWRMTNMLDCARGIVANSKATLDDLADFAKREERALPSSVVAWLGIESLTPGTVEPTRLQGPHFVTVGTIEGRKNHLLLLRVWRRLVERFGQAAPKLLIVGQRGWEAQQVFDQLDSPGALQDHVVELSRCSDAELAGLLSGAQALLMPSFAEGFGLPVAEALRLGTRVIASDLPALREIGGEWASYLCPDDDSGWEEAIALLTADSSDPDGRPPAGYRAPDWRSHFAAVDNWLELL